MNAIAPFVKPIVQTPSYWLANIDAVYAYLDSRLKRGKPAAFGASALHRRLMAVAYEPATNPRQPATRLMVIGGTHGHEPGGVAAAMNLIHLLETGVDLDGRPHDRLIAALDRVHLTVVPMLNPDGRAVCLDSFYNFDLETVRTYACGLTRAGDLVPYDADSIEPLHYYDPTECIFVGGQFNGAGWAINRPISPEKFEAVEAEHLVQYLQPLAFDAVLDLHACGYNFLFQARSHEPVYWPLCREWQRRAEALFRGKGYPLRHLEGDGNPPVPLPFAQNSRFMHKRARLMWLAFEGRQGHPTRPFWPLSTEWEILDAYLDAVSVFVEIGAEGAYARANAETFGCLTAS